MLLRQLIRPMDPVMWLVAPILNWNSLASSVIAPAHPNIVVIVVNDSEFSDFGCYGGEIDTPHIDALAESGLRFSQIYNAGRCCPTRASLLTGLYPHKVGSGHMPAQDNGKPGYSAGCGNRVSDFVVLRE